MTKLRDRHGRKIDNVHRVPFTQTLYEGAPEHLCEDCPLSLRCLSGRLTKQRGTYLCYKCGYLLVEDWVETVVPFADGQEAPMVTPSKYKFKCEQRPLTKEIVDYVNQGRPSRMTFMSGRMRDTGPGDWLLIQACPWCKAEEQAEIDDKVEKWKTDLMLKRVDDEAGG